MNKSAWECKIIHQRQRKAVSEFAHSYFAFCISRPVVLTAHQILYSKRNLLMGNSGTFFKRVKDNMAQHQAMHCAFSSIMTDLAIFYESGVFFAVRRFQPRRPFRPWFRNHAQAPTFTGDVNQLEDFRNPLVLPSAFSRLHSCLIVFLNYKRCY